MPLGSRCLLSAALTATQCDSYSVKLNDTEGLNINHMPTTATVQTDTVHSFQIFLAIDSK